jgi:flagellar biosynthesis protein FlhB
MAEQNDQERTEEATPRKRDEAHREGQVPRSNELNTAFLLLGAALLVATMGPMLGRTVVTVFHHSLIMVGAGILDGQGTIEMVQSVGWQVAGGLGLFMSALFLVALFIGTVQARGVISLKPIEPKWNRINPITNIKQKYGVQPWMELAKSLMKLTVISFAVFFALRLAWGEAMALSQMPNFALLGVVHKYAIALLMTAGFAYIIVALMDYFYQMWRHEKNLRMSKQEVKQEHKQMEGDPLIKARRRSMARSFARRRMMSDVPLADVIITNPTHIAVALKYDPAIADAPVVLAMGQRKIAEKIKEIAAVAGVPMVENKPLARALISSARIGVPIPAELYIAVAEVLAFVIRQRNAVGAMAGGRNWA